MAAVTVLFTLKIIGSLLLVVFPFMFMSRKKLDGELGIESQSDTLYRLYGMAIIALLVGYGGGIYQAVNGTYPVQFLLMGLVSNLGATYLLIKAGLQGKRKISGIFFGGIGLGCALALSSPELAMQPLF